MVVYIYAPKDYDGLMIALNKKGTSKQSILEQMELNNKYEELSKEALDNGEKSEELIKLESKLSGSTKILDTNYEYINSINTKDELYAMRVNDINKAN